MVLFLLIPPNESNDSFQKRLLDQYLLCITNPLTYNLGLSVVFRESIVGHHEIASDELFMREISTTKLD